MSRPAQSFEITADILLRAYSIGLFPTLRLDRFEIRADENFDAVVIACASRENTWINAEIRRLYRELFDEGRAHSIEAFEDGALVGGLYGVSLGAAFFGESMFHLARDASKVALVHLVARLRLGGLFFFTPLLNNIRLAEVLRQADLPGSQMVPAVWAPLRLRGNPTCKCWGKRSASRPISTLGQPLARCVGQRR